MSTTPHPRAEHPVYGADSVISSTEAARLLRAHPHDPLAFNRLDSLRAAGKIKPVRVDSDCWFLESEVLAAARPWEHEEPEDVFEPAAAVGRALVLVGVATLAGIVLAIAWSLR